MRSGRAKIVDKRLERRGIRDVDLDKKGRVASRAMAFDDSRVRFHPREKFIVIGTIHIGGNEGGDRSPKRAGGDNRSVSRDDASIFKSANALDHGGTGQADPFGERLHSQPSVFLKLG